MFLFLKVNDGLGCSEMGQIVYAENLMCPERNLFCCHVSHI